MFASIACHRSCVASLSGLAVVVVLLALAGPLPVGCPPAANAQATSSHVSSPRTATAKTKSERPSFTPSDVNDRTSYLDESSDSSLFENAEDFADEKKWSQAIALWDKLLKKYPNCPAIVLRRALVLRASGLQRPALHILEKLVKDIEAKGEIYYSPYHYLAETYIRCGDRVKAEQTCLTTLKKFPDRSEVVRAVLVLNRHIGSTKVATEARSRLQYLSNNPPKYDTTISTMKLPTKQLLPQGVAYEIIVSTDCFPRFKLTMTHDRVLGDTGVAKYIIGPPNYEQVILLNDESQNYFKTSIGALMQDHCNREIRENRYGKITILGEKKLFGENCIELKCQDFGESSFERVALAKNIVLAKPLARTISLICGAPVSEFLPLSDIAVKDGYPVQRLNVSSIKKVKVTPAMMVLNPKYHQVKNKGELIYASNGDLKDSDLDQFLQSK